MGKRSPSGIAGPHVVGANPLAGVGPTVPVDIKTAVEEWSEYRLSDGSVLSVKPLVADVRRVKGKFNDHGDPLYLVTGGMVIRTKAPRKLRRKGR